MLAKEIVSSADEVITIVIVVQEGDVTEGGQMDKR